MDNFTKNYQTNYYKNSKKELKSQGIFWKGKKPIAFLILHGWSATPQQAQKLIDWLKKRQYWIIAPLLRGHGTKPEDLEKINWQDWQVQVEEEVEKIKQNINIKKIFLAGISMGGNLALLVSIKKKVDGIILIGTPVHLKNHFWIWLGVKLIYPFKKYLKKSYPKGVKKDFLMKTSYQYFPVRSVSESLKLIKKSVFSLRKVKTPLLILQSSKDYLVAKYSPWIIFNASSSEIKKFYWIKSNNNSHVLLEDELKQTFFAIEEFINLVINKRK